MFTTLFADDGTCIAKHANITELTNFVNIELQKVANWFLANKMMVNTTKTKFILFRTPGKFINDQDAHVVFNSNEIGQNDPAKIFAIERIHNNGVTKSFKLLGVLLDEYLSFDHHINMLCNKISKSLYIINRVKNLLPRKSLCTLYFSLVHTHLNYCASIFGCATKTKLKPLVVKQKQAIRVITNSQYRAHTNPLFKELNIMPLNELIVFSQLKFMYKFKNNMLPLSFAETWITNRERNPNLNLRNADNIYIPPPQTRNFEKTSNL